MCGKEYIPSGSRQKYCGSRNTKTGCGRKNNLRWEKKYRTENYEKIKNSPDHKIIQKNSDLKRNYGITHEIYGIMAEEQHNKCVICDREEERRKLSVDHCHTTKLVRGLLCSKCNAGLGMFNHDIELLQLASRYLLINGEEGTTLDRRYKYLRRQN